jgi:hypothetical protein
MDPDCIMCGGTNEQEAFDAEGNYRATVSCLALPDGANPRTQWLALEEILKIFITCSHCRETGSCQGCEYEREHVMSYIYHYGELIKHDR